MKAPFVLLFALFFIQPNFGQNNVELNNPKVGITFSFPWVNNYHYVDYQKNKEVKKFGFFGIGLGLYYIKDKSKITFNASTTGDLASPIAQINYATSGPQTGIGTSFTELIYQRSIYQTIHFVAGLNLTSYNFHYTSGNDSVKSYIKKDVTLGLTIGVEYRFDKNFSVATIYRPAFASFETDSHYRHLITLELRIDLDVWKKK